MYLEYYHLHEKPFEITPDPKFIWFGTRHKAALETLRKVILNNEGIVLLSGAPGTGKSTFLSGAARYLGHSLQCVQISDPSVGNIDFFRLSADAFGIGNSVYGKEEVFSQLRRFAFDTNDDVREVAFLIDDAHRLSLKHLRQLQFLGNIRQEGRSLIQIVFTGQSQCKRLLPDGLTFKQTVALNYTLQPLTEPETVDYIRHRLRVAGAKNEIFTDSAMAEIFHLSGGIARLVNIICDNALLSGCARNAPIIGSKIIMDSHGPVHRLIHEICELDKELSAQNPAHLPSHRGQPTLALGASASSRNRTPVTHLRRLQILLKRLGLMPLTVKGAMVAPLSLITLLGIFGHFYFSNEDKGPPFTQVHISSESRPGSQGTPPPVNSFNRPSGVDRTADLSKGQTHEGRAARAAGPTAAIDGDRLSAHQINQLRGELQLLRQQLQVASDARTQLEQKVQTLEQALHTEKDTEGKLVAESSAKASEIQELRNMFESFKRQQLLMEKDLIQLRDERIELQTRLMNLSGQKTQASSSADELKTLPKKKRTVAKAERKKTAPPAASDTPEPSFNIKKP
jgi:type II secretory pathway predicted ATPase ExeA